VRSYIANPDMSCISDGPRLGEFLQVVDMSDMSDDLENSLVRSNI
jgi:hypothetical protein